jgi:hypothetical protein
VTPSPRHRDGTPPPAARWHGPLLAAGACLVAAAALACAGSAAHAEHHESPAPAASQGGTGHAAHAASDLSVVEIVSTNVEGKNVFIPSTIVVEEDKPHTLSIFNTTAVPHGFAIDALGIQVVLPQQQETQVSLPALKGDRIYKVGCHLHPPHRSARLVVLDLDD